MTRRVGVTDPERFQVEIQFSAGAAYDPFGLAPSQPHVLPIRPRFPLFQGVLCVTPSVGVKPQYKWVGRSPTSLITKQQHHIALLSAEFVRTRSHYGGIV